MYNTYLGGFLKQLEGIWYSLWLNDGLRQKYGWPFRKRQTSLEHWEYEYMYDGGADETVTHDKVSRVAFLGFTSPIDWGEAVSEVQYQRSPRRPEKVLFPCPVKKTQVEKFV